MFRIIKAENIKMYIVISLLYKKMLEKQTTDVKGVTQLPKNITTKNYSKQGTGDGGESHKNKKSKKKKKKH